jgi:Carbohydrate-binding family 9
MPPMSGLPELFVPTLSPTERLVALPALRLLDARTGEPPRLRTSLRIGRRGDVLCVRFDGRDEGVVATYTRRDAPIWEEDVFEVFLSPGEKPASLYYEFEVNPLGTLFDARVESPDLRRATMRVETAWDSPGFAARVSGGPGRWSASLRIPLDELVSGPIPRRWRANFYRIDRGDRDEFSAWSPTLADPADFHVPERFGTLRLGD